MTEPKENSAVNHPTLALKQESAAELYKKNPHWTGADLYNYRMSTMSAAEQADYNEDLKALNDFSEAAIQAMSGAKNKMPNILDESRDHSGDNILSDAPDHLDLDLSLIDGVYQLPPSDDASSRPGTQQQKPTLPDNSRR